MLNKETPLIGKLFEKIRSVAYIYGFSNFNKYKRHLAFTLAEVLITLLVIGVVASIVIPNLINDTQNQEYKVALKKAYSTLSDAVRRMKMDTGEDFDYYIHTKGSFKPEFIKYFNVTKDCGWSSCVPAVDESDIYKTYAGEKADTSNAAGGEGQFVTADGMFINIQNTGNYIGILVDVNGYTKPPNVYGKDYFSFEIANNVLVPSGSPKAAYKSTYCNKNDHSVRKQGFGCTAFALQDIDY